uniref:Major sperm protein n=1 Tax=Strongyloides papillosus TaxID=174720 RepID=A0A0N5B6G0_STREA
MSIFDPLFQMSTPLYYLLKVFAISTIYLRPFKFGNVLKKVILRKIDIVGKVTERHFDKIIDKCVKATQSDQMLTAICKCDSITSKVSKKSSSSKRNTKVSKVSESSTNYEDLKKDFYSTPFNEKSTNILFRSAGDLAFSVDKYLSFAKSFTREISENVYVKNLNSLNPIIFNIKSNAPNFVSANPGRGIIEPEETLIISMTLKPFPPDFKLNSFIIVIEYNIAPIGTNTFSSQLIDGRCRKIFKLRHYL